MENKTKQNTKLPEMLSWKPLHKTDDQKEFLHKKTQQFYHWATLLIQDAASNK